MEAGGIKTGEIKTGGTDFAGVLELKLQGNRQYCIENFA